MPLLPNNRNEQDSSCKYIVSACLAGIDCTYNGKDKLNTGIRDLVAKKEAIAVCPEVLGGSGIRRESCEICHGDGDDVLVGKAVVRTESGKDISHRMISGAQKTLMLAKNHGVKIAILKSNSPSCGVGTIYDGTFSGQLRKGNGVTAAMLIKNDILVYDERNPALWQAKSIT